MRSCRQTRLKNIDRWRRKILESQEAYSKKRAIGLLLRAIMFGKKGHLQLTLQEVSEKTGMAEMELDRLYQEHANRMGHEYSSRWIYHTGNKMFYFDGG